MAMAKRDVLRQSVEHVLRQYDPIRTGDTAIHVDVTNGTVVLRGYVRTDNMKFVAEELAGRVKGVSEIRNDLVSDSALEVAIALAIEEKDGGWLAPLPVQVRVVKGSAMLRGAVPSEGAKEEIEHIVLQAPHVLDVHNLLVVDPVRIERAVAPKKGKRIQRKDTGDEQQAMVGGEPVTEEDLPAWALKPKDEWGREEYKARAQAKIAFKRGEGPDPNELEEAGRILREQAQGGGDEAAEEAGGAEEDDFLGLGFDEDGTAPAPAAGTAAPAAPVESAMTVEEVREKYPAWALKPKDDWDMDEFKAHAKAKSAAKKGEGPDPDEVIQEAQQAFEAAQAAAEAGGGAAAAEAGPSVEEVMEQLEEEYPAWALKPKDEWDMDEFKAHAKAKSAAKKGEGPDPEEVIAEAQEKLETATSKPAQPTGDVQVPTGTPGSRREALAQLRAQFPAWALKPRKQWTADDFRDAAEAKVAELRGTGQSVEEILQAAQDAIEKVKRGEEVEEGAGVVQAQERELTEEELEQIRERLLDEYPAWALKPKEDWSREDFKDRAQTKSASKKGEAPPPEELEQQAQEALEQAKQEWLAKTPAPQAD